MFTYNILEKTEGPWVFRTQSAVDNFKDIDPIILSGDMMQDRNGFYNEIYKKFRAPGYAGKNFNALSEILTDLSWITRHNYILFIQHPEKILSKEKNISLKEFIELLSEVGEEWSNPINQGKEWDRPAIPFHSILELETNYSHILYNFLPKILPCIK